jgi:starch-binding outer membrane protein, SusD/RagB family
MKKSLLGLALAGLVFAACDEPLDVDPRASIPLDDALTNARAVAAATNGLYDSFQYDGLYSRELIVYPEMYADNVTVRGTFTTDREVGARNILPSNIAILAAWRDSYRGINQANEVLQAVVDVPDLTSAQRTQFRGEALFVRSLHFFNLVRYFGGVPIITTRTRDLGDVDNAAVARATPAQVYARIIADLEEAADLLPDARSAGGRATADAANALLARVYLESAVIPGFTPATQYALARDKATLIIDSERYRLTASYSDLFQIKNSVESIFEVQYTIQDANALAFWFFPNREGLGGRWGFSPSASLINAYELEDLRYDASIGFAGGRFYNIKYFRVNAGDDNVIVLRLGEMYLIRAEANARLGAAPALVRADINVTRVRAGLDPLETTVTSEADLITEVLKERRLEFAMEGHRFFDLRRTGRAETVLGIQPFRLLWPIPLQEIEVNPLLDQNPGY